MFYHNFTWQMHSLAINSKQSCSDSGWDTDKSLVDSLVASYIWTLTMSKPNA